MDEEKQLPISILGVGSCIPSMRLTNKDLEGMVDTSDEWITKRTGIKERSISTKKENVYVLTALAAKRALDDAGIKAEEIDAIYVGTNYTGKYAVPGVSHIVQHLIGAKNASASDVGAGCSGGLYAMENGIGKILNIYYGFEGKKNKGRTDTKVLALAGDTLSAITNYKDRDTCVLLADAAAGIVLGIPKNNETQENEKGIYTIHTRSQGEDGHAISYKTGFELPIITQTGTEKGIKLSHKESLQRKERAFRMDGNEVFKFAVRALEKITRECVDSSKLRLEDVKDAIKIIPHQANLVILDKAAKRLGIPMEHMYHHGIVNYGNSSAASLFVELDYIYRNRELEKGDLFCLSAFGAGLTYAAACGRWTKEKYKGEKEYNKTQQKREVNSLFKKFQEWEPKS
ncbi:MAG: beta-ketoacyl-ACP synthase 3 [Nanoarchaeota archaeon]|nr:beta-ketoacyl-ACP synthase 3 [Nanoarchaeota archaeon]